MATLITMKNKEHNLEKKAYIGFSWTSLLFGGIPALCRGDWLGAVVFYSIYVLAGIATAGIASLIIAIVWPFIYNKWHARRLIEQGYTVIAAAGMSPESVQYALEK